MDKTEISIVNFNCAVEGCNSKATHELWEDFEGQTLFLSTCSDPEHESMIKSFLKEKADMGRACLEFEARSLKLDDIDLNSSESLDWEIAFSDAFRKYMKKL